VNTTPARLAASIGICVVVAGCAGQSGPSTSDCHVTSTSATRQVVTEIDSGRCLTLVMGQTAELRLAGGYRWSAPQVSGNAGELIPIAFLRDPGYSAWEVRSVRLGTSAISASGTCAVAGCAKPTLAFTLTITVP